VFESFRRLRKFFRTRNSTHKDLLPPSRQVFRILDSYSVQSENLFLTYSCRQKVDDFLNGVIRFAIRGLEFTVYGECWVWLSVKQAVGQRATDTLVEKDKHHGDF